MTYRNNSGFSRKAGLPAFNQMRGCCRCKQFKHVKGSRKTPSGFVCADCAAIIDAKVKKSETPS